LSLQFLTEFVFKVSLPTGFAGSALTWHTLEREVNLAAVFSVRNQEYATWLAFAIACAIQLILLLTYAHPTPNYDVVDDKDGVQTTHPGFDVMEDPSSTDNPLPSNRLFAYRVGNMGDLPPQTYYQTLLFWLQPTTEYREQGVMVSDTGDRSVDCPFCDTGMQGTFFSNNQGDTSFTSNVLSMLNLFNIVCSTFTFVLFLTVRVPVKYQKLSDPDDSKGGMTPLMAALNTSTDVMTLYYAGYTVIAMLALSVNPHGRFLGTLLLLDIIVKDPTTTDVLLAVYVPFNQLNKTVILCMFSIYIFAFKYVDCPLVLLLLPPAAQCQRGLTQWAAGVKCISL
jgi:hypothetical protein